MARPEFRGLDCVRARADICFRPVHRGFRCRRRFPTRTFPVGDPVLADRLLSTFRVIAASVVRKSLYINLAFLAGMSPRVLARVCALAAAPCWFIFLLPFWFQTLVNLANLVVWHLAGHMFHVRQAKRIFGLIVGGNWIANIVGGVLVASLLGNLSALASVSPMRPSHWVLSMLVSARSRSPTTGPRADFIAARPALRDAEPLVPAAGGGAPVQPADLRLHAAVVAGFLHSGEHLLPPGGRRAPIERRARRASWPWQLAVMGVVALVHHVGTDQQDGAALMACASGCW